MALTDAQLKILTDGFIIQMVDLIQASADRMFGYKHAIVELETGATDIFFPKPYETGTVYNFTEVKALNSEGYDIDFQITNKTKDGFRVTVAEACTFEYACQTYKTWISDETLEGPLNNAALTTTSHAGSKEVEAGETTITFTRDVDGEAIPYPFTDARYIIKPDGYADNQKVDLFLVGQTKDDFTINSPVACTVTWIAIKY